MWQFAKVLCEALLLPPGGILILLLVGLTLQKRWPRAGTLTLLAAAMSLYILSSPAGSIALTNLTGRFEPFSLERIAGSKAIVVLAGEDRAAKEYGGQTVGSVTLERLRMAAEIARVTRLPLLLSGGVFKPGDPAMSQMMATAMQNAFGLEAKWLESNSRNTHENALQSAKILTEHDVQKIVLVTDMFHMRRSVGEFTRASISVVPAPVNIPISSISIQEFRPNLVALQQSTFALRELVAQAAYLLAR